MCYHRTMRRFVLVAMGLLLTALPAHAADALAEARRLYNAGKFDLAAAAGARSDDRRRHRRCRPGRARPDSARTVPAARAPRGLHGGARVAARRRTPVRCITASALELSIGLARGRCTSTIDSGPRPSCSKRRWTDRWCSARRRTSACSTGGRPRSTATRSRGRSEERPAIYARILERMSAELATDGGSAPASYWLVAAARGTGDLERAWQAAIAGWVRASQAPDRGAALRADLDRLVTQAIIPERAARLKIGDPRQAAAGMATSGRRSRRGGRSSGKRSTGARLGSAQQRSSQRPRSALRFLPVLADADVDRQRHRQRDGALHQARARAAAALVRRFLRGPRTAARRGRSGSSARVRRRCRAAPRGRRSSRASGCRRRCPGSAC